MPRKAKLPQANLPRIRKEFQAYLEKVGTTPTAFAKSHGVNQSTVQRFLAARTKTVTPKMKPLLRYANIAVDMCISDVASPGRDNARIREALEKVWDGRESTAEILAKLIESVGPAIMHANRMGAL